MNKHIKKILAIVMAIAVCIPMLYMYSYADDGDIVYHDSGIIYNINRAPEDEVYIPNLPVRPRVFYSNNSSDSYLFYNNLNSTEKAIYNSLKNTMAGLEADTQGVVPVTFSSSRNLPSASSAELKEKITLSVCAALSALLEDYPEYFWIGGFGYNFGSSMSGSTYYLASLTVYMMLNENAYPDWNSVRTYHTNLMNSVAAFEVNGVSRYAKLKSIHDQLAAQVTYDPDFDNANANPLAHEPTGVFTEPYYAVCEGYAEAFKLICDRENIPCITVVGLGGGGAHKWNYVKMEDGKWYGVDVTWDDQGEGQCMYDYFLVGTTSKNGFFGGTDTFSSDHVPQGTNYSVDFALTYPELSNVSYTTGTPNINSTATFSNPKGMMFIPKSATLTEAFTYGSSYGAYAPSDHTVSISGTTTTATVTVSNSNASPVVYKVVRWGDINASNSVNVTDYNQAVNTARANSVITDECKFAAGDLTEDGVIDGFDAIYLELYVNGDVEKY